MNHPLASRYHLRVRAFVIALCGAAFVLHAGDFYVSPTGNDGGTGSKAEPWKTIQKAASSLKPGDTAHVLPGTYREKVNVNVSGSEAAGPVSFVAEGAVIVSGEGIEGENIFRIQDKDYVKLSGFEIRDNLKARDGSGIRIQGACDHVEITRNRIHEIRGKDAMGITVYGRRVDKPVSNLLIEGNEVFDCDPAKSEAITLNGNITDFRILNNVVRDVNNIGICMIGGEAWINKQRDKVTRHGLCKGNKVMRARSSYGSGYAAGIYVDGGSDIVVEDNEVTGSNLGIEVGAENAGTITKDVTVRNNRVYLNEKAGIVFGGYESKSGRVEGCRFEGNICYHNDRHKDKNGELWMQWATNCRVENNVFWAGEEGMMLQSVKATEGMALDHNMYYSEAGADGATFVWRESDIEGFEAYRRVSQQDAHSRFFRPDYRGPEMGDFSKP